MAIRAWVGGVVLSVWLAGGGGTMAQFKDFGQKPPQPGNQENTPRSSGRSGYTVDANNPQLLIFPGLGDAPAPDWVKPGLRLTFFSASATIPNCDASLVQDPNGNWVDPNTGKTYSLEKNSGSYGDGYNQLDVVSLTEDAVVFHMHSYGNDLMGGPLRPLSATGVTMPPGAAADWWVNPAVLNNSVDNLVGPGVKASRIPYQAAGKQYQAVWINTITQGGSVSYVIDLDSGLTLNYSSSHNSGPDGVANIQGKPAPIGGHAMIGRTTYLNTREVRIPWSGLPLPKALDGVRRLVYEGQGVMTMQGISTSVPVQSVIEITGRGPDFIQMKRTDTVHFQNGAGPQQTVTHTISGTNQLAPLCIPPPVLAKLRNGQEIDRDPFTKVATFVSFIGQDQSGNEVLTLTQFISDKAVRWDYVYELSSGMLCATQMTDPALNFQQTLYRTR